MDFNGTTERIVVKGSRELIKGLLLFLYSVACWTNAQPISEADGCPAPMWVRFSINCYTFVYTTQKHFLNIEHARELCKDIGADIISISSREENEFLVNTFQTKWRGTNEVLLGMFFDSDDNRLKWFDNSPLTFINWKHGDTTEEENMNTCMKMNTLSGAWETTNCDNFTESATLCKTTLRFLENDSKATQRTVMIVVTTTVVLAIPGLLILLFILDKKNILRSSFSTPQLLGAAQVLPYSDRDVLVDTMESEDCA